MEKKTAGLLGALAGLATTGLTIGSAQATMNPAPNPSEALHSSSYADLLAPIPNASALLKADDEARAQKPASETPNDIHLVQDYYHHHHHHHHHHHRYRRHHHHHHHHHHRYPVYPVYPVYPPRYQ